MQLDLAHLSQLAEIHKKLSSGYHISEHDFNLWQELDVQEDAYCALFAALGHSLKRDSRGFFYFEVDEASASMGKISRLFALAVFALVEYYADKGQDPLRSLFEQEISTELWGQLLQQHYHLFEQLEIFSVTDLKREIANRFVRHGLARHSGDNLILLPPVYRYLDALMDVEHTGFKQDSPELTQEEPSYV